MPSSDLKHSRVQLWICCPLFQPKDQLLFIRCHIWTSCLCMDGWTDRHWLSATPAGIDLSLLNMNAHTTDLPWQEPVRFFGSLQNTSAHLSKAKHRRPKRKTNSKETWQWSQQDGMSSCFSDSHLTTILICHFQSISRHESNFAGCFCLGG